MTAVAVINEVVCKVGTKVGDSACGVVKASGGGGGGKLDPV